MIPQIYDTPEVTEISFPSTTYKIDLQTNHISGKITGLEAVIQSTVKILLTERYGFEIYSSSYGVELETLIGKDFEYVLADITRRLNEALTVDDRIQSVTVLNHSKTDANSLLLTIQVNTVEGAITLTQEVLL